MNCLCCKKGIKTNDAVVKIIFAKALDDQGCFEFHEQQDDSVIHGKCFDDWINNSERLLVVTDVVLEPDCVQIKVERTDILNF